MEHHPAHIARPWRPTLRGCQSRVYAVILNRRPVHPTNREQPRDRSDDQQQHQLHPGLSNRIGEHPLHRPDVGYRLIRVDPMNSSLDSMRHPVSIAAIVSFLTRVMIP